MKVNISSDCTWWVEDRYGTAWEEALESGRRGAENKEAYLSQGEQTMLLTLYFGHHKGHR
eukprot:1145371-Pelagomonas_calceolata.AAC.1